MSPTDVQKELTSEVDVQMESSQLLRWVVRDREDLQKELNAHVRTAPDFSQELIHRVVRCIEEL